MLSFSEELVGADVGADVDVVDEVDVGVDVLVFSALLAVLTVLLFVFAGAEVSSLPQPVRLKATAAQSAAAKILFFILLFLSLFFGEISHKYHYIYEVKVFWKGLVKTTKYFLFL